MAEHKEIFNNKLKCFTLMKNSVQLETNPRNNINNNETLQTLIVTAPQKSCSVENIAQLQEANEPILTTS